MHPNTVDITGEQFGRFTVLYESKKRNKGRNVYWVCSCVCGNKKDIEGYSLRSGNTKSCGCLHRDMLRLKYGEATFNKLYDSYIRSAEKRKIKFSLTKEEFEKLTRLNCYYCGSVPSQIAMNNRSYGNYIYNGVDRKNNNLGYSVNNCVSCCKMCNYMKHNHKLDVFLSHIRKIYEYLFKR